MTDAKTIGQRIARAVMRGAAELCCLIYDVQVNGLESVEASKPAIFGVKHSSWIDAPAMMHAMREKGSYVIFAKRQLFRNWLQGYFLRAAGFLPINQLKSGEENATLLSSYREFYEGLKSGQWCAYAPEGTRVQGEVGKIIHPELLIRASEKGGRAYLVGVSYRNEKPWRSLGRTGVLLTIEPYDASNKTPEKVTEEVRKAFARLSGLEKKLVETPVSTPGNDRQNLDLV